MFQIIKKVPIAAVILATLASVVSGGALAWSGDKDDCGIWLCLPTGFAGSGCKGPLKKHIKRVTHFKPKPPMPNWGSCIISSSQGKQGATDIVRNQGTDLSAVGMADSRNALNVIKNENQPYTTHYEFTTYSKFFNKSKIEMVERGRKSNESNSYCHTGYRYGVSGYNGSGHGGHSGTIIENGVYYNYVKNNYMDNYSYNYTKVGYCTETITTVINFGDQLAFDNAVAKEQEMSADNAKAIEEAMALDSSFKNMVSNAGSRKSLKGSRYEQLDYGTQGMHSGQPAWVTCQGKGYDEAGQGNWKSYENKDSNYVCKHVYY